MKRPVAASSDDQSDLAFLLKSKKSNLNMHQPPQYKKNMEEH